VIFDWGGLMDPLVEQQEAMNLLGLGSIENYLAISDESWGMKDSQVDRTDEIDRAELDQGRQIIDAKVATERDKLALKTTTDAYVLAVRVYDAKVRALVMGAREYASLVEREQLEVEASRAVLAVAKEELRQDEINAKIYYEVIQRAQVEAELARAQVDVAKANVRALMADIEAGKAEVELIEAQVQEYVAMAEKATLQSDVAMIYAEIITKKLSVIKLDMSRQEIEAGFGYIQSKCDDMLALWETRTLVENFKAEAEALLLAEVDQTLVADRVQEDLREAAADNAVVAMQYEIDATTTNLSEEAGVRDGLVAAKKALSDTQREKTTEQLDKGTWAQILENVARIWAAKHGEHWNTLVERSTEYITG
jgi:hypothetical protein